MLTEGLEFVEYVWYRSPLKFSLSAYGGNDTESDPARYGYTSPGILESAQAFFKAGADYDLRMDWAQGLNQGAGAAFLSANDPGAAVSCR